MVTSPTVLTEGRFCGVAFSSPDDEFWVLKKTDVHETGAKLEFLQQTKSCVTTPDIWVTNELQKNLIRSIRRQN
ncbi:hypothetical protein HPP92_007588 [Vanilla planifolia]|uniref:Uncharacterized protein n=1 Tax=Vanilla planifolia TaxID=51239 RepID=A0A835RMQ7_VANPL|nr:hypothetical protein HPP92_007588 [Vanilla planifolia]